MTTGHLGDKTVQRIGFGAMQLAGPGVMGPPRDPEAAAAVLRRAIELGVDHIDTSQFYGPDTVNQLIHDTLHPYPEGLRLVSKVGARRDSEGAWLPALSPAELRQGVEDNLRTLAVERLDLVNLRVVGSDGGPSEPTEEQLATMVALREEGKIDLVGVSNVSRVGYDLAASITPLGQVQNAYSIVNRDDDDLLDACAKAGTAFVPFFPLGSAFSGGPGLMAEQPAIADAARKHDVSASQIALAWLLARDDNVLLIPGTTSVAHLEENLAAGQVVLDADDLSGLDQVAQLGGPLDH